MRFTQLFAGPYDGGPRDTLFERVAGAFALPDELRQQLILSRRPGWQAHADLGRPSVDLPFRGLLDRRSRRALADELALFKPDLVAVWDAEAMARLPEPCPAVTLGIADDLEVAFALRRCRYLAALTPAVAAAAVERGWPEERVRLLPVFAEGDLVEPLPRAALATSDQATVVVLPFALDAATLEPTLLAARRLPLPTLWMPGAGARATKLALRHQVPLRDLGPGTDRARAIAAADLVLANAPSDRMALAVVEGWAQSRPVIAAGAPAAAGLLRHEDNGILAREPGPDALAAALRRPLDDPLLYDRLSANGRASFDSGHGEARSLARWLDAWVRLGGLILPDTPAARAVRPQPERPHTDIQV